MDGDMAYVEVYDEPLHPTVLENEFVRVMKADCPANESTMFHRHSESSFFLFFRSAKVSNEVMGKDPVEAELDKGAFYYGDYLREPMVHRVCVKDKMLDCMDVEFKADRPRPSSPREPLRSTANHEMCFENEVLRAYRVKVAPGKHIYGVEEGAALTRPCLVVAMNAARFTRGAVGAGDKWWVDGVSEDGSETNVGDHQAELFLLEPK